MTYVNDVFLTVSGYTESELSQQSENLSREVDGFIARIGGR
ncbi:hypothetical protein [Magnetospirillum sp. ME-1]|nr:hypothetical protein [Magnetospirillum sp. ME-1]